MSVILCTRANFANKNSRIVARIVPYYTAGAYFPYFRAIPVQRYCP